MPRNLKGKKHFENFEKNHILTSDPLMEDKSREQNDNFCRGYQADQHTWVTWPYRVIWRSRSIFRQNHPFWPLWRHRDLWPHHCLCVSSGSGTGHFDQVWSKSDVGKYVKKACCQNNLCNQSNTRPCGCAGRVKKQKRKRLGNKILRLRRQDKKQEGGHLYC